MALGTNELGAQTPNLIKQRIEREEQEKQWYTDALAVSENAPWMKEMELVDVMRIHSFPEDGGGEGGEGEREEDEGREGDERGVGDAGAGGHGVRGVRGWN